MAKTLLQWRPVCQLCTAAKYGGSNAEIMLKGIEYNSSIKGKGEYTNEIVSTNCESESGTLRWRKIKKYLSTM